MSTKELVGLAIIVLAGCRDAALMGTGNGPGGRGGSGNLGGGRSIRNSTFGNTNLTFAARRARRDAKAL
jgi:hypothetical protein